MKTLSTNTFRFATSTKTLTSTALLMLACVFQQSVQAGKLRIDDFTKGAFICIPATSFGDDEVTVNVASLIGGSRTITIAGDSDTGLPHSFASLSKGSGSLDYQRNQNSYLWLKYGDYLGAPGTMNLDLTKGKMNAFSLTISSAPGPFTMLITVTDIAHNLSSFYLEGNGPGTYLVAYSSFYGNAQFNQVGGIGLELYSVTAGIYESYNQNGLYSFSDFSAVTAP